MSSSPSPVVSSVSSTEGPYAAPVVVRPARDAAALGRIGASAMPAKGPANAPAIDGPAPPGLMPTPASETVESRELRES